MPPRDSGREVVTAATIAPAGFHETPFASLSPLTDLSSSNLFSLSGAISVVLFSLSTFFFLFLSLSPILSLPPILHLTSAPPRSGYRLSLFRLLYSFFPLSLSSPCAPVGSNVSSLSARADLRTISRQRPLYVHLESHLKKNELAE